MPAGKGSTFKKNVRSLLVDQDGLSAIVLPMLEAWRSLRIRAAELGHQLVAGARQNQSCRIFMSIPGVGAITATSFATAIEDPDNFRKSRSVGAWVGLTTRRYQRAVGTVSRQPRGLEAEALGRALQHLRAAPTSA